jgi:hypothetical protein
LQLEWGRRITYALELKLDEQPVETTVYSLNDSPPEMSERRSGERHLSLLRVGVLMIDGRRELCLIKNVSAGGMLIRAYCSIPAGAEITVELKQGEPIKGHARWVKGDQVGVTFDQPIDVLELLSSSADGPRPRMPRVEVDCLAWVREGSTVSRMRTANISQGGLKVEGEARISTGSEVTVSIHGLAPLAGTVRWHDSGSYGITFNRVIALPALVAWLQDQRDRMRKAS